MNLRQHLRNGSSRFCEVTYIRSNASKAEISSDRAPIRFAATTYGFIPHVTSCRDPASTTGAVAALVQANWQQFDLRGILPLTLPLNKKGTSPVEPEMIVRRALGGNSHAADNNKIRDGEVLRSTRSIYPTS